MPRSHRPGKHGSATAAGAFGSAWLTEGVASEIMVAGRDPGEVTHVERLSTLVEFLDRELNVEAFDDSGLNGLQVENSGRIRNVCCGVDASLEFFAAAAERKADLLICHHGISWGDSLKRLTGRHYRLVAFLLQHDMALYGCHLPLDAHPRYGNNAQLAQALGLEQVEPFGVYRGSTIGFRGRLPKPLSAAALGKRVSGVTGREARVMPFGRKTVRTLAVISGAAPAEIEQAAEAGVDAYLSGESSLQGYNLARDHGINVVWGGHYATETFGVKALAGLLSSRFKVRTAFLDFGVAY